MADERQRLVWGALVAIMLEPAPKPIKRLDPMTGRKPLDRDWLAPLWIPDADWPATPAKERLGMNDSPLGFVVCLLAFAFLLAVAFVAIRDAMRWGK